MHTWLVVMLELTSFRITKLLVSELVEFLLQIKILKAAGFISCLHCNLFLTADSLFIFECILSLVVCALSSGSPDINTPEMDSWKGFRQTSTLQRWILGKDLIWVGTLQTQIFKEYYSNCVQSRMD